MTTAAGILEFTALVILCLWGLLSLTIVAASACVLLDLGGWWDRLRRRTAPTPRDRERALFARWEKDHARWKRDGERVP